MDFQQLMDNIHQNSKKLDPSKMSDFEKCIFNNLNERDRLNIDYITNETYLKPTVEEFLLENHSFFNIIQSNSKELEAYLNELSHYSFAIGWERVDQRSTCLSHYYRKLLERIASFYIFEAGEMNLKDLIYGNYRNINFSFRALIAGYLLTDHQEAIQYTKDVLLSENNTAALTDDLIRAIMMSRNEELQDLLLKVFLAARLQEGFRQSIVEACDEYQLSFFIKTMKVIKENQLTRYSSVQRAIVAWCQLGYDHIEENYVKMLLDKLLEYYEHTSIPTLDDHPLDLYLKLYTMASKDSDAAIDHARSLFTISNKASIMAIGLFYRVMDGFHSEEYPEIFDLYQDDPLIMAIFFDNFKATSLQSHEAVDQYMLKFHHYLKTFKEIKNTHIKGFDYIVLSLDKSEIAYRMMALLEVHTTADNMILCLPYLKHVTYSKYYRENKEYLFSLVPEEILKPYCISNLSTTNLQEICRDQLYKMELKDEDLILIEDKLKSKRTDTRKVASEVLNHQPKDLLMKSYERLINDKNVYKVEAGHEIKRNHPEWFNLQEEKIFYSYEEGFGIFKKVPLVELPLVYRLDDQHLFTKTKEEILTILQTYHEIFNEHRMDPYFFGDDQYLLEYFKYDYFGKPIERLPLADLWKQQYEKEPLDIDTLFMFHIFYQQLINPSPLTLCIDDPSIFMLQENEIKDLKTILTILNDFYLARNQEAIPHLLKLLTLVLKTCKVKEIENPYRWERDKVIPVTRHSLLLHLLGELQELGIECLEESFPVLYNIFIRYNPMDPKKQNGYEVRPLLLIKAYLHQMISFDELCTIFLKDYRYLRKAYEDAYFMGRGSYRQRPHFELYSLESYTKEEIQCLRDLLNQIADQMVMMETKRINEETPASQYITTLYVVNGIKYLPEIVKAIGHDHFVRTTWNQDKLSLLTELVKHTYPIEGEDLSILSSIPDNQLIEIAMLATQWIKPVSKILNWDGLEEGFYYFIAHMKEAGLDEKKAIIAHYTDMDPLDLRDGAFDRDWFIEVYHRLGIEKYSSLYQSAKFLCDNSYHTRVRRYGDAVLGLCDKEEIFNEVKAKRNKDLLNVYAIIPITDQKDLQERYLYIQQFIKESKQFGAQRQASEKRAGEIALLNLAKNSPYESATRLTWAMESSIVNDQLSYLQPKEVLGYTLQIQIDDNGDNELIVINEKGKQQKSIPAKIKKNEIILEYQNIHKEWQEQKRRSKRLLEEAMEDRIYFTKQEVESLLANPIVSKLLTKLVVTDDKHYDLINLDTLSTFSDSIRIAHCYDLYQANLWQTFQEKIYELQIIQPFKQVFRELYTKLPEEMNQSSTNRYSGYQIEVKKAAGALKNRRWSVSYEEGLEKIDYQSNIVVNLYADADWFSPSDIEAPAIDHVMISDRRTGNPVLIQDIPDITYSEIMRDIDLAVSISAVGGVDPITNISTIELRKNIAKLTAKLLKLNNIEFKEHFMIIQGSRATYMMHLQTGMVRQIGSSNIFIVPVHSQKRGKLYLPFIDEDPKCQEIISKMVLLSEDHKIKDPAILDQIH